MPSLHRLAGVLVGVAFAGGLLPRAAAAQLPDGPYTWGSGRVVLAGEGSASISPPDDRAFFNYTNYKESTLRLARLSLLGEWHVNAKLSLLGELQTESGDALDARAWYLRWRPWTHHELTVQVGRIPPVVGAFARQPYGRDNPLIGVPLAYQYLTSLRPDALPATVDELLKMRGRGWQPTFSIGSQAQEPGVPLVNAFRWGAGVEARWRRKWLELAGAVTEGSSAVPVVRQTNDGHEVSGRVAVQAPVGLTMGVSGARGQWIDSSVLTLLPITLRSSATQSLGDVDVELGRGRWLARGEWMRSTFQLPIAAAPMTLAAWSSFAEVRYRWRPRWQLAARVERLSFSTVRGATFAGGAATPWDAPVDRVEADLGFRAAKNLEGRVGWQQDWRPAGLVHHLGYPALQLLYWF